MQTILAVKKINIPYMVSWIKNVFQKISISCVLTGANSSYRNKPLSKQLIVEHVCAAHIGMGGVKIKKEPRQRDEYVYRIS